MNLHSRSAILLCDCIHITDYPHGTLTLTTVFDLRTFISSSDGLARHTTGPLQTLRVLEAPSHRDWVYLYLTFLR